MKSKVIQYRNLPQLLLKGRENILQHFRPIITHFGLTEPQWRILRAISEHGELEPREIMDICQILSPSLSGILKRMEEMDLVSREHMQADRRRQKIRLTDTAQQVVRNISHYIQLQYDELEKVYGKALIQELFAVLDKYNAINAELVQRIIPPPLQSLDE